MADAAAAPGARDLVGVRARVVETALRDLPSLDLRINEVYTFHIHKTFMRTS